MKTWSKAAWKRMLLEPTVCISEGMNFIESRGSRSGLSPWHKGRRKLSKDEAAFVGERDRARCVYCDKPYQCFDHYLPVSRGGLTDTDNTVCACSDCNSRKADMTVIEWLARNLAHVGPGLFWNGGKP